MKAYRLAILSVALLSGTVLASAQDSAMQTGEADTQIRQTGYRVLSPADHDLYARAFDMGKKGNWLGAQALADQGHDPLAGKLLQWEYALDRNSGASFDAINSVLKDNPDWPLRDTLYARAEAAIGADMTPAAIVAWFGSRTPASSLGRIKRGEALAATGNAAKGRDDIQKGWIEGSFEPADEAAIAARDAQYLTPEVQRQRLDNLLWRDDVTAARRQLARVDDASQKLGQARIALKGGGTAARKALDSLSGSQLSDLGLMFDRIRAARRAGNNEQAQALLQQIPAKKMIAIQPARWWSELQINARQALQDGDPRTAYTLVKNTGLTSGTDFAEAEFLAGWLALRYLKDPQSALTHFRKLDEGVSRPISKARARYWLGRAYEEAGDLANAYAQYKLAAQVPETYYGQIALTRIDATPVLHIADTPVDVSAPARADFDKSEMVRAMRILADLGLENSLRAFANRTAELYPQIQQQKLLMQLMVDTGYREIAVRLAKAASYNNVNMPDFTFPVIPLPAYQGPGTAPESALVLGLIRQETEFDPDAVSSAGATGIIQVMPANARNLARKAGIVYRPGGLTDPDYAIELGMVEFNSHLDSWMGSIILASAAYNAGPSRAKSWVAEFGDPRSPTVDPVDWIEAIPFPETRNYVQRVLENTQVYRNRLAGKDQPLRILSDLYAPNAPSAKVLNYKPPAAAAAVPMPAPKPDN